MLERVCVDCGTPVVTGVRCRPCNGAYIAMQHAIRLNEEDQALLHMVQSEQLSAARLGDRLGISRMAADLRINGAKKRQALLASAAML